MSIFTRTGFDSLISKGLVIRDAALTLPIGSTTIIDGDVFGPNIKELVSADSKTMLDKICTDPAAKTTLVVNGNVECVNNIEVRNVIITGNVKVDVLICEGTLAIKAGAKVIANEIRYREIIIENGAVVLAKMGHLDHISAGEQV